MSKLGTYELTHPESLSEHQLREILKNNCIEILNFEKLCKSELLEMYRRVAMPLPQRQRNAKILNTEVNVISDKSTVKSSNDMHSLAADLNKGTKRMLSQTDRKLSVNDPKSVHKKNQLYSASKVETTYNGINKRRCNEQNEESIMKKRQKITWP
ncbi:uncharacterized protein LOC105253771 isoform X1 [Camponotus floridanus]|uniref:uncharacterized protein LOC105253771 isoform X1 n=1 Tax=Camponotus floridanus TaxID=104421 RepID=UPI00059E93FA|nr:uncharacterized protein LOC105253771 isoform X1 [Camponotus floridanus]